MIRRILHSDSAFALTVVLGSLALMWGAAGLFALALMAVEGRLV